MAHPPNNMQHNNTLRSGGVTLLYCALFFSVIMLGSANAKTRRHKNRAKIDPIRQGLRPLAQELLKASQKDERNHRLALIYLAGVDGERNALGDYLTQALLGELTKSAIDKPRIKIVERSHLDEILNELSLAQTGLIAASTSHSGAKVGKLLGADMLLLGTATVLPAVIDINARLVDSESGNIIATADTQVPKAPLTGRIPTQLKVSMAPPLSLSSLFLGERQVGKRFEKMIIRDGSVLRSGDGLKIAFETSRRAFVYVLLLDSQGKASVLFPSDGIDIEPRVPGGTSVELPPDNQWFFLDNAPGTETLYVVATLKPLGDIKGLRKELERIARNGHDQRSTDAAIVHFTKNPTTQITRGIGGIRPGRTKAIQFSNGEVFEQSQELLRAEGTVVRAITFTHE